MISVEIENRLSKEMIENLKEYYASLHCCKENSRQTYVFYLRKFSRFLVERGITRFEDANARDLDAFLTNYDKTNTLNNYIRVLKSFYKFLKLEAPVDHLKEANQDLPLITPADVLTPEEIIKLGIEAGHRRVMYKYLTYIAFESCARANEYLNLRVGDVVFSSVRDKEGQRMLIATLYFKRAKGGVNAVVVLN